MPLAVVHFLVAAWATQYFIDRVAKEKATYPKYYVLLGGIVGLLPDIDLPISAILTRFISYDYGALHNGLTHVVWIPLFFFGIGLLLSSVNKESKKYAFLVAAGCTIHITLDFFIGGSKMIFYPVSTFIFLGIGPLSGINHFPEMLDAIVFLGWIVYLYRHDHLSRYY